MSLLCAPLPDPWLPYNLWISISKTKAPIPVITLVLFIFEFFRAHDYDLDGTLDGLELLKALSHEHNFHHEDEDDEADIEDTVHDPVQHTDAADRVRFNRIVSKLTSIYPF